jgi:hypothetical protein
MNLVARPQGRPQKAIAAAIVLVVALLMVGSGAHSAQGADASEPSADVYTTAPSRSAVWIYGAASPLERQILIGPKTSRINFTTPFVRNQNLSCWITRGGINVALSGGVPLGATGDASWVTIPAGTVSLSNGSPYSFSCEAYESSTGLNIGTRQTVTWNFTPYVTAPPTVTVDDDSAKLISLDSNTYWPGAVTGDESSPSQLLDVQPGNRVRVYGPKDTWNNGWFSPVSTVELFDGDKRVYGAETAISNDGAVFGFTIPADSEIGGSGLTKVSFSEVVSIPESSAGYALTIRTDGYFYLNLIANSATQPFTDAPRPTLSGTAHPGFTLTANAGVWSPAPESLTYQWRRGASPIRGATGSTYKLVTADVGELVNVLVTGSKQGSTSLIRTSSPLEVTPPPLTRAPTPTITGTAKMGATLTAKSTAWSPAPVTLKYQWYRDGASIDGAVASTYQLIAADANTAIGVAVTGSKAGYASQTKWSADLAISPGTLTVTPTPTITGVAKVGTTLTAKSTAWSPAPVTLKYQWTRGGLPIAGATNSTYKLAAADANALIAVAVTGTKTGYASQTKTSTAKKITPATLTATPKPTIAGTAKAGSTLKATVGTWSPSPVTLSYQWKRAGSPIAGATSSSYKLVAADRGKAVTFTVTGSKPGYTTVIKSSDPKTISK